MEWWLRGLAQEVDTKLGDDWGGGAPAARAALKDSLHFSCYKFYFLLLLLYVDIYFDLCISSICEIIPYLLKDMWMKYNNTLFVLFSHPTYFSIYIM